MSTGCGWEGLRQVCATPLGARHVPERLCGGLKPTWGAITNVHFYLLHLPRAMKTCLLAVNVVYIPSLYLAEFLVFCQSWIPGTGRVYCPQCDAYENKSWPDVRRRRAAMAMIEISSMATASSTIMPTIIMLESIGGFLSISTTTTQQHIFHYLLTAAFMKVKNI